jgi:hypothetical protein
MDCTSSLDQEEEGAGDDVGGDEEEHWRTENLAETKT